MDAVMEDKKAGKKRKREEPQRVVSIVDGEPPIKQQKKKKKDAKRRHSGDAKSRYLASASMSGIVDQLKGKKKRKSFPMVASDGPQGGALSLELKMEALAARSSEERGTLRLKDLQDLVCWTYDVGPNPRWAFLRSKDQMEKMLVIGVGGLDMAVYQKYKECLPSLGKLPFL